MSEVKEVCDQGINNLIQGIIGQAVSDYVNARLRIDELNDRNTSVIKVIREDCKRYENTKKARKKKEKGENCGRTGKPLPPLQYKIKTLQDAEKQVDWLILQEQKQVDDVIRFFNSEHYTSMCDIDGKKMLEYTEAKYKQAYDELHEAQEDR